MFDLDPTGGPSRRSCGPGNHVWEQEWRAACAGIYRKQCLMCWVWKATSHPEGPDDLALMPSEEE